MPALVYLPESEALFLWGTDGLPLPGSELSQLAEGTPLELVAREQVLPTIRRQRGRIEARWAAALATVEDASRVTALASAMPPAAHAVPASGDGSVEVWTPDALLRAFLDAAVDVLVRDAQAGVAPVPIVPRAGTRGRGPAKAAPAASWDRRWQEALQGSERAFAAHGFAERSLLEELQRWSAPALGVRDRLRACFRLELPAADGASFVLRFLLQAPDDASLLVPAAEVWRSGARSLAQLGRAFRDPEESLLEALARAARLFAPIEQALVLAQPESLTLDPAHAWQFLARGAALLAEAGFGVIVPGELTASGQRRLRLRMRVGSKTKLVGAVFGAAGLGLDELLAVDWQAVIGDQTLTQEELAALADRKAPLVQFRGAWVAIDPAKLPQIQARLARGPAELSVREAVQIALAGEAREGPLTVAVSATGSFAGLLQRLQQSAATALAAPSTLQASCAPISSAA